MRGRFHLAELGYLKPLILYEPLIFSYQQKFQQKMGMNLIFREMRLHLAKVLHSRICILSAVEIVICLLYTGWCESNHRSQLK